MKDEQKIEFDYRCVTYYLIPAKIYVFDSRKLDSNARVKQSEEMLAQYIGVNKRHKT